MNYKKYYIVFMALSLLCEQLNATVNKNRSLLSPQRINEYKMVFEKPNRYEIISHLEARLQSAGKTIIGINIDALARNIDHLTYKEFINFTDSLIVCASQDKSDVVTAEHVIETCHDFNKQLPRNNFSQSEQDFSVACHEAAHAVSIIRECLHCKLASVSIVPQKGYSAGRTTSSCRTVPLNDYESDTKHQIINRLAGGVAQQKLSQEKGAGFLDLLSRKGCADDIENALVLVFRLMQLTATPDQQDVLDNPHRYGIDLEYEKFKALESLYPATVEFVETHKKDILAVAADLVQRKEIKGNRVHQLINVPTRKLD